MRRRSALRTASKGRWESLESQDLNIQSADREKPMLHPRRDIPSLNIPRFQHCNRYTRNHKTDRQWDRGGHQLSPREGMGWGGAKIGREGGKRRNRGEGEATAVVIERGAIRHCEENAALCRPSGVQWSPWRRPLTLAAEREPRSKLQGRAAISSDSARRRSVSDWRPVSLQRCYS